MNHNEYKKLIQLSLYGELSEIRQLQLEEHLHTCEECKSELESQKNLLSIQPRFFHQSSDSSRYER